MQLKNKLHIKFLGDLLLDTSISWSKKKHNFEFDARSGLESYFI